MKAKMGIYKIVNIKNGKQYIGKSVDIKRRWKEHKRALKGNYHKNIYLQRAWDKYNEKNFKFKIIQLVNSEEELNSREIYWIKELKTLSTENGYNLTSGGEGESPNQDVRNRIRNTLIEYYNINPQAREKARKTFDNYYKSHPEERRYKGTPQGILKMKESSKGRIPWNKGIPCSQETKDKLSLSLKGNIPWNKGIPTNVIPWNKNKRGYKIHTEEFKIKIGNLSRGESNGFSKLTNADVIKIKEMLAQGITGKTISSTFGITETNISSIKNGQSWSHIKLENISNDEIKNIKSHKEGLKGSENINSKLKEEDIIEIKTLIHNGYTNIEIAQKYNVSPSTISDIKRNKTWSQIKVPEINEIELKNIDNATYGKRGEAHNMAKLTEIEVIEIKKLLLKKIKGRDIAKMYNVDDTTISMIKRNKIWKHIKIHNNNLDQAI